MELRTEVTATFCASNYLSKAIRLLFGTRSLKFQLCEVAGSIVELRILLPLNVNRVGTPDRCELPGARSTSFVLVNDKIQNGDLLKGRDDNNNTKIQTSKFRDYPLQT